MKPWIIATWIGLASISSFAAGLPDCSIIPRPQKCEHRDGVFKLGAETRIFADVGSRETGRYLADRVAAATGFELKRAELSDTPPLSGIVLDIDDSIKTLGAEGYELTVAPQIVIIRASDAAGIFYGVQSLLQLFPPAIFSTQLVTNVEWHAPCIHIEDRPRFQWRGMLLDVSRHFFTKSEVERILDLMALHKLNVFHWHLVDDDGWRLEIKKHPRLAKEGGWRPEIGYGLDPRSSTAFSPDGQYGGFYTQDEVREIVAYAQVRHITVVPEIEMPGHSGSVLKVYPELLCTRAPGSEPFRHRDALCIGNEQSFSLLQDVLTEVFAIFPSKYIHIGGDEVNTTNWKQCPKCRARLKEEGLHDERALQSSFLRRIEKFINQNGRSMVGWSEVGQGNIAKSTILMDWIGGSVESATAGHEVVMAPTSYCYFDYYQSADLTAQPHGIGGYVPLESVYTFDPIPEKLDAKYHQHILGAQATLWSEYIPSQKHLEFMTYPRLCALAEVVWSPKASRNWEDFKRRLSVHELRLDRLGVNYFEDHAEQVGEWSPSQVTREATTLEWDISSHIVSAGKYHVIFDHVSGSRLNVAWAALLENGKEISRDTHAGGSTDFKASPVLVLGGSSSFEAVYVLTVPSVKGKNKYTLQAQVTTDGSGSAGQVKLDRIVRRPDW